MDSRSIEEISLNEVLENTVKSYDKVLSSHEEILSAKVCDVSYFSNVIFLDIHKFIPNMCNSTICGW